MNRNHIAVAVLVSTAIVAFGCTSRTTASEALGSVQSPESYSPATVREVAELDTWRDRKIVFDGIVGKGGCADCGGVVVTDRTWRIGVEPVDPSKFRIPARAGARLKVWGVLEISGEFRQVRAERVEFLDRRPEKRS